jgi:hypothetical protein
MDDLKVYAETKAHLKALLRIVEAFSKDICMSFGLDKCKILSIIKGNLQNEEHVTEEGSQIIAAMKEDEVYKYLGMKQQRTVEHGEIKRDLLDQCFSRTKNVLKTGLNSRNLCKAINTHALTVLSYSFGIIKWSRTDLEAAERRLRKVLTKSRKHHPISSVERVTLPREMGGRGITDIVNAWQKQIRDLRDYFHKKAAEGDELLRAVTEADNTTPLNLQIADLDINIVTAQEKISRWMSKELHGRHINEVNQEYIDVQLTNSWLQSGKLFPETEGFMIAIQDQVIPTRNYMKRIVRDPSVQNDYCRYGCMTAETIQHITAGCQAFAGNEYTSRHDAVARIVHQELAIKNDLLDKHQKVPYYQYEPDQVLKNSEVQLYWNRTIMTDRTMSHNRPDITIWHYKNQAVTKVQLIDITIPNNNNIRKATAWKIEKYAELREAIREQWRVKDVSVVPIVISNTGLIPKQLKSEMEKLELNAGIIHAMQKATILWTTRIVRKYMGSEVYTTTTTTM